MQPKKNGRVATVLVGMALVGALTGGLWTLQGPGPEIPPETAVEQAPAYVPDFVSFDVPRDQVRVNVVGEGLEVINSDPSLTGQEMTFWAKRKSGEVVPFSVTLPPPVPEQ